MSAPQVEKIGSVCLVKCEDSFHYVVQFCPNGADGINVASANRHDNIASVITDCNV